jgi:hypothetical protein
VGNRILGVLLLALAAAGVVVTGDRVDSRRGVVVTAGPGTAAGATSTTVAVSAGTEVAAPGGAAPAPGAATTTTTTTITAPAATSSSAPAPTDQALVQQMVLRQADLPAGFDQQKAGTSRSSTGGGEDAFDSCLGPDTATLRRALVVRARSPNFARRPASVVSSAAALFDTPASAGRVMAVLRSEAARDCLEKRANDRLADDPGFPEGSSGTMTRITLGAFGEETRAYRLEVRMPPSGPDGKDATYLADFLFVRKGRAVVMVQFGSLDQPFPLAEAQAIAGRLAARM